MGWHYKGRGDLWRDANSPAPASPVRVKIIENGNGVGDGVGDSSSVPEPMISEVVKRIGLSARVPPGRLRVSVPGAPKLNDPTKADTETMYSGGFPPEVTITAIGILNVVVKVVVVSEHCSIAG
jgi:hypothetical protein